MSSSWSSIEDDCSARAIDSQPIFAGHTPRSIAPRSGRRHRRRREHHGAVEARAAAIQTDGPVVGRSEAMRSVLAEARQVAPTTATVLLLGETGVGKEVVAQTIHDASPRRWRPMISVSCAAIPATLIESELFGHERGAFTGAQSRQIGRFEAAHGSTLFLDEIGELPLEMQVKLLRVLQERTIERLGAHEPIKVDARIIAATNRDLESAVRSHTFRQDLFYRLNVFPITIPPLRQRIDDIGDLAWSFVEELSRTMGKRIESISSASLRELQNYPWPGNVRELRNVIERAVIVAPGPVLWPTLPGSMLPVFGRKSDRLVDVQTEHIMSVLTSCGWRIRGPHGAAVRLGMKPTTLTTRMARLGIGRESRSVQRDDRPPVHHPWHS